MSSFLPSALGPRVCKEISLPQGPGGATAAKGGASASLALRLALQPSAAHPASASACAGLAARPRAASDFVQGCKDPNEEELEELPEVKVEWRRQLGEGSCWHGRQRERGAPGRMEIRGRTVGESSVASLPPAQSL
ncbi:unnamed protein product [Rangifer tarandus platyrhynchus]|uniref:Uncharacterized protein n=1 Tax=Rangifer tarandus platyrhynchus TaxID=3082113 RepID=A0AC59YW06_RANTA